MMKYAALIVFCFMSACTATKNYQTSNSYFGVIPHEQHVNKAIANDMATFIAMQYAPGHTSFNLIVPEQEKQEQPTEEQAEDTFSVVFENALRQKGFEISQKGMDLSFTIDSLEEGTFYTQIRFGDGKNFSSLYSLSGTNITRSSHLGEENE